MKKFISLLVILIQLSYSQTSGIETTPKNENGFRLNLLTMRGFEHGVIFLPITMKYSHYNNKDYYSDNYFLSLPAYYGMSKMGHTATFEIYDYLLIPLFIVSLPVVLSNYKMEQKLTEYNGIIYGFNTDYYDSFKFDWKTQSELFIGFYIDYKKVYFSTRFSSIFTNRIGHRYPLYVSFSLAYTY